MTVVNCGTPPPVTNGVITGSDYSYNSTITYSCIAANYKLSGPLERICQADGQWSGTQPVCLGNFVVVVFFFHLFLLLFVHFVGFSFIWSVILFIDENDVIHSAMVLLL